MSDVEQQVYNGRYELQRKVARGGMADVFLARDSLLDRLVALKVLFPEFATDPAFVERFRREAQSAANLSHPNIVSVYDWGEETGTYFIVMEYIDGPSLAQCLRDEGPLDPMRAAAIGSDIANALAFAHRNGVVHRDVKPGNILMADGNVKVADFGIARAVSTAENLTQTGTVMGTATYFAPEQARGEGTDQRSDVYALGVVLYEMLTGAPPFAGDSPLSVAYKHVQEQPQPPRVRNPSVPPALEAMVLKCLAKDPADRYATAEELRADLDRFRDGTAVLRPAPVQEPTTVVAAATIVTPPPRTVTRRVEEVYEPPLPPPPVVAERSSAGFFITLGVLLLVLLLLLFLFARNLGVFGEDDAEQVEVPSVVDLPLNEAVTALTEDGFDVIQEPVANDSVPDGIVFAQEPEAGINRDEGSTVTISVSSGRPPIDVPNVVGQQQDEAIAALFIAGLEGRPQPVANDNVPLGEVISQDPPAAEQLPEGGIVNLTVSSGPDAVEVPNVVGQQFATASNQLGQAGLGVEFTEEEDDAPEGTVIRTDPAPGAQAAEDSTVVVVVSSGPPPTTTTSTSTSTTTTTTTTTSAPTTTSTPPTTTATTAPTSTVPTTVP